MVERLRLHALRDRLFGLPRGIVLLVVLFGVFPLHVLIGSWVDPAQAVELALPFERRLPISLPWLWIYIAVYLPGLALPVVVVRCRELFARIALTAVAVQLASFLIFIAFPVSIAGLRVAPAELPLDTLTGWGLALTWFVDPPVNCCPSLHVGLAFAVAFGTLKAERWLGWAALVGSVLVGVSTLQVKQHFLADVLAAFVLAAVMAKIFIAGYRSDGRPRSEVVLGRRWLLVLPVFAALICLTAWLLFLAGWRPWEG